MTKWKFREPTTEERGVFDRLLEARFPGHAQVSEQLAHARVRPIDRYGSLEVRVATGAHANVSHRVPVEAMYSDEDGIGVLVLLHVVDGLVVELEVVKTDDSQIRRRPSPEELQVFSSE
jgi:hypothetical protein